MDRMEEGKTFAVISILSILPSCLIVFVNDLTDAQLVAGF
jgi:hypothetical protein